MYKLILFLFLIQLPSLVAAQLANPQFEAIDQIRRLPADEKKIFETIRFFQHTYRTPSDDVELFQKECDLLARKLHRSDLLVNLLLARSKSELRLGDANSSLKYLDRVEGLLAVLKDTVQTRVKSELAVLYIRAGSIEKRRKHLRLLNLGTRGYAPGSP